MYASKAKKLLSGIVLAVAILLFVSPNQSMANTTVKAGTAAYAAVHADGNTALSGVIVVKSLDAKCGAGKCGAGKCGDKDKAKTKTEAAKKAGEKMKEGKCGAGKCGSK